MLLPYLNTMFVFAGRYGFVTDDDTAGERSHEER